MKLKEIFDQLTYGELSQLSIGGGEQGFIDPANYPKVVAHINLGLTALFKRFRLKEGQVAFKLIKGKTVYRVGSDEDLYFLNANFEDEFNDDILKIDKVMTADGYEFALNNGADEYTCTTPSASVLRLASTVAAQGPMLPPEMLTESLHLVYRANHPLIVISPTNFYPDKLSVELPYTHLEALLYFVASRVNNPIGMTNEFNVGNNYYAKYENACVELESQGMQVDNGSQNTRLARNGWV